MLIIGTNTYVTAEEAQAYIEVQGLDQLSSLESFLIRAGTALDRLYGQRFLGTRLNPTQPMAYPRSVYAEDLQEYPRALKEAQIELAVLLAADVNLYAQPEPVVIKETNKIDTLEETKEYKTPYSSNFLYKINLILAPIIQQAGSSIRIVR